jgi:hypothetical protein
MPKSSSTQRDSAQLTRRPSVPGPEHKRLEVFLGKWNLEGQQYDGLVGSAAKIAAVETYEWLPGRFFLVHHFDGQVGDGDAACIEIIGYDASSRTYPAHTFYNNGQANEWQGHEHEGIWTFTGDWPMADESMKVRCTIVFSNAGNVRTGKWDYSSDGSKWQTFWDVKARKA